MTVSNSLERTNQSHCKFNFDSFLRSETGIVSRDKIGQCALPFVMRGQNCAIAPLHMPLLPSMEANLQKVVLLILPHIRIYWEI